MSLASLDLTHVLYNSSSNFALAMALVTLSPILLMASPSYAALAIFTREITIINMWAGQFCCEAFNLAVKRLRGQRLWLSSSHSQYMAYFATFLILHLHFKHKFASQASVYLAIVAWAVTVAYSRYHLSYHSVSQILWGLLYPHGTNSGPRPNSLLGKARAFLLMNPVSTWLRIRDGWAVWSDSGTENQWQLWQREWRKRTKTRLHVN
ncbi:hypothetical protein EI94DRAFT_1771085 [Lactarius quietus]|nr:hypothetical protein EI94DRAFT_1771085 [Lactarius quietus]